MPASIGVNLRVTGHCSQGGRKYMEDLFSVAYQQTEDERDLEYAFFGIYDGHGGSEAAAFAKEHLMDSIVKQRQFWSDNDEDVLKAIRNGYMLTHLNMWKELEKWPKTVTGLPSTAGTTASVAFIRRGKIYIGHVGDSAIVLGYQKDGCDEWAAKPLTSDHKPESTAEIERIQKCGGKVVSKAGVPRVVWNRPRLGHKGPIKKNTPMDEIPFLAVARSLGDLWSYNPQNDEFIVSPDPDVGVLTIDPTKFRCLIFGTDGLWNMISAEGAVGLVQATERHNEAALVAGAALAAQPRDWLNPSKSLVDHALERWSNTRMRADNTSVVTLMLDPPGPPRATVLRSRSAPRVTSRPTAPTAGAPLAAALTAPAATSEPEPRAPAAPAAVPQSGLTIMTRYSDGDRGAPDLQHPPPPTAAVATAPLPPCDTLDVRFANAPADDRPADTSDDDAITNYGNPAESYFISRLLNRTRVINTLSEVFDEITGVATPATEGTITPLPPSTTTTTTTVPEPADVERAASPPPTHTNPAAATTTTTTTSGAKADAPAADDVGIQINEVSSSSPTECPPRARGRRARADAKRDVPAPNDRVLRSHHDVDPAPPRPHTRQVATRGRPPPATTAPQPPPAPTAAPLHRVVILNRRAPPAPQPPPPPPPYTRTSLPEVVGEGRATRSGSGAAAARELRPVASRTGNSGRAPGPARRAPAARRDPSLGSKENRGAARRRARPRAAPAAPPAPPAPAHPPPPSSRRRAGSEPEVHSTTGDAPCAASPPPAHAAAAPRALRSRNDAGAPPAQVRPQVGGGAKRARLDPGGAGDTVKVVTPSGGGCRPLSKRSSGPWAPALALRNRLRKRLAK